MNPRTALGPALLEAEERRRALGTGLPRASSHAAHAGPLPGDRHLLQNPLPDGKKPLQWDGRQGWGRGRGRREAQRSRELRTAAALLHRAERFWKRRINPRS